MATVKRVVHVCGRTRAFLLAISSNHFPRVKTKQKKKRTEKW